MSNAEPDEILSWKNSKPIKKAYAELFNNESSNLEKVIEKSFGSFGNNDIPLVYQAWAIAITETVLNPKYNYIDVKEDVIRPEIEKFLVSISIYLILF